jgi:hypothetical protein
VQHAMTRRARLGGLIAGVAAVACLALAPSAFAGGNGQQIQLYTTSSRSAWICGNNQYNNRVCRMVNTNPYHWTAVSGWWWKGTVGIANYADPGGRSFYLGNTYCGVPTYQSSSNWAWCHGTPARGNETKRERNWWGFRIWLSHPGAQSAYNAVKASGNFSSLVSVGRIPTPIAIALKYITCTGDFINKVGASDVGYGVVLDVPYYAPFWACGLKVWSQ